MNYQTSMILTNSCLSFCVVSKIVIAYENHKIQHLLIYG